MTDPKQADLRDARIHEIMESDGVDEMAVNEILDISKGGEGDCIAIDDDGNPVPRPPPEIM